MLQGRRLCSSLCRWVPILYLVEKQSDPTIDRLQRSGQAAWQVPRDIHQVEPPHNSVITWSEPSSVDYQGCFAEGDNCARKMQFAGQTSTIATCQALAGALGAAYSGSEHGNQCYHSMDPPDKVFSDGPVQNPHEDCRTPCRGNVTEFCGGSCMLSVYRALSVDGNVPSTALEGCFFDPGVEYADRKMTFLADVKDYMTNDLCARLAKALGSTYAATQFGSQCYATVTDPKTLYNVTRPASNSSCSIVCAGASGQICGGKSYNWVHRIDDAIGPIQPEGLPPAPSAPPPPPSPASPSAPAPTLLTPTGIWSAAQKAGIIIGIIAGLATVSGFIWGICKKRKANRARQQAEGSPHEERQQQAATSDMKLATEDLPQDVGMVQLVKDQARHSQR